jgi:hypothetical protein
MSSFAVGELLANYGDYLGQTLQEMRASLKAAAQVNRNDDDVQAAVVELGVRDLHHGPTGPKVPK